jgi:hypothetical protein
MLIGFALISSLLILEIVSATQFFSWQTLTIGTNGFVFDS